MYYIFKLLKFSRKCFISLFAWSVIPSRHLNGNFGIEARKFMGNWINWFLNTSMFFAVQNLWDRYLLHELVSVLLRIVLERIHMFWRIWWRIKTWRMLKRKERRQGNWSAKLLREVLTSFHIAVRYKISTGGKKFIRYKYWLNLVNMEVFSIVCMYIKYNLK